MAEATRNHDSRERVEQRLAAANKVDLLTESQLRSVLGVIVADSWRLDDDCAAAVLDRIISTRR
jgi:hypothetical protein